MTVCNMSIEAGAKAGLIAPDDDHLRLPRGPPPRPDRRGLGRRRRPTGARWPPTRAPPSTRRSSSTPPTIDPFVSWGTNPGQVVADRRRRCPPPTTSPTPSSRDAAERALEYMGLDRRHAVHATSPSTPCSSARAPTAASRTCGPSPRWPRAARVADGVRTLVVPGSYAVKAQAEAEGLDEVLRRAGLRLARPGLLDVPGHEPRQARAGRALRPPPRNRNFEGRQGRGGRTHLVSPAVAAATAVAGHFATPVRPRPKESDHGRRPHHHRHRRAPRPLRRRHRPDHPQRLAQAGRAHRLRQGPVLGVARRPRVRAQPAPVHAGASILVAGPELRHRLVSREHAVWAIQQYGFAAVDRPALRRHLPQQRDQERSGAGARSPARWATSCCDAVEADPTLEITIDVERRTPRGAGARTSSSSSRSTTRSSTGSSKGSTTSASPSATTPTSTPSRPPAPAGTPPPADPTPHHEPATRRTPTGVHLLAASGGAG